MYAFEQFDIEINIYGGRILYINDWFMEFLR